MPMKTKELQREFNRKWIAKRRADYFAGKSCAWCRSTEKLVIHHTDPKTKISHAVWSWTKERRAAELEKCIILCETCHVKHHAEEKRRWTHGIASTYKKGRRCEDCRHANKKKWYAPRIAP
jgi:hypothetical protein